MCKKTFLCMFWIMYSSYGEALAVDDNTKVPVSDCGEMDCFFGELIACKARCGCNKSLPYRYNITTGECVLNLQTLLLSIAEKYKTQEKYRKRNERIFQGVIISGILVIVWATVCIFSGCFYCIRIKYTDRQLRKCVKEVAKKLRTHHIVNKSKQKDDQPEDMNEALRKTAVV